MWDLGKTPEETRLPDDEYIPVTSLRRFEKALNLRREIGIISLQRISRPRFRSRSINSTNESPRYLILSNLIILKRLDFMIFQWYRIFVRGRKIFAKEIKYTFKRLLLIAVPITIKISVMKTWVAILWANYSVK